MSQQKVDYNKQLKRNRKQIVKRRKRHEVLMILLGVILSIAIVCFIAYSGYGVYEEAHANDPLEQVDCDLSAITDYVADLNK